MSDYTLYPRGSQWRRWDLHLHTPETKKNDQFEGSTLQEKWDKFVEDINTSNDPVRVVGITDYFCVDNYFRVKQLIKEGKITKPIDLLLPNVEIRVLPVTGSAVPLNLHCIFNPAIDADIEFRFLAKLKFRYSESDYSAKKEELTRLGKAFPGNGALDNVSAMKAGLNQYVVTMETLRYLFDKDPELRNNVIIVVSNKSTDGNSGLTKHEDFFINQNSSQLDATRWSIYQFADAIFSANDKDVKYFIGQGSDTKEMVLEKCKTLMPCFHGCDAHTNIKIFKPDNNRFCWIKADPTFEGLKQTIYEPIDRVRIQSIQPDLKNDRFVISELNFVDDGRLFGRRKILLNDNLNAIIGGKSSGKSLLLYSTANAIDPEQVTRASRRLNFEGYSFDFDFEVGWKNGERDLLSEAVSNKKHKITYIPQLYINYLVEKNNKEDLNSLIKSILIQDTEFKQYYESTLESISRTTADIEKTLVNYLQIRSRALEVNRKMNDLGKSETIDKAIQQLKVAIAEGQKTSNLGAEDFADYNTLMSEKTQAEIESKNLDDKSKAVQKIVNEVVSARNRLLGSDDEALSIHIKGEIDRVLDEFSNVPEDLHKIRVRIGEDFNTLLHNLTILINGLSINVEAEKIQNRISGLQRKLEPFLVKLEGQKELQKLSQQLEKEKLRYDQAVNNETQLKNLLKDYEDVRRQTVALLQKRFDLYTSIVKIVNDTRNNIGSEITLKCELIYKKDKLPLFDQTNKAAITYDNIFNTLFADNLVKYETIIELYTKPLRVYEEKLFWSNDKSIPLRQNVSFEQVLQGMLFDGFEIDFTVSYKNDDLLSMSPGKKGTVLLILFLQISSAEYPILIDQPEDNLDNRTIYELLCTMIKKKKTERQMIIVSHNANLVVATDAENIIVANQEGQTVNNNSDTRFEYVNGSIEHSFPKDMSVDNILLKQGIKEHVCDILEGGNEAFKQREKKYSLR
jgi:ABC-type dipeptide/oligopeptide/nickel transport system ATPase component